LIVSIRGQNGWARAARGLALVALLALLVPATAQASPETLRRSLGNIIQAPIDVVLAPIVAGRTLIGNLRDIDDTTAVRVFYTVPGFVWLTGIQAGAGVLRGVSGFLELLPGIFLLPFDTDMDALFDPADRGAALVELENPLAEHSVARWFPIVTWNVRFGVTYTSAEY
jgi:hypothetical protein